MDKEIEIQLVRGLIGSRKTQRRVVEALGLKRRMQTVRHKATPSILGMVEKVKHLVEVREL